MPPVPQGLQMSDAQHAWLQWMPCMTREPYQAGGCTAKLHMQTVMGRDDTGTANVVTQRHGVHAPFAGGGAHDVGAHIA